MASKGFSHKQKFVDCLQLPDREVKQAFVYFSDEIWPRITKLIASHLQSKDISCVVTHMVESDKRGFYNPWILVRVIPISKYISTKVLEKDIKNLMAKNGLSNPLYGIHIESGKRAPKFPPAETKLNMNELRNLNRDINSADSTTNAFVRDQEPSVSSNDTDKSTLASQKASKPAKSPSLLDLARNMASNVNMDYKDNYRSVKHLTCFYWMNSYNGCRKSAEDCAYAHEDTGHYADKPRAVFPGGPRLAGRNATRVESTIRDGIAKHLEMESEKETPAYVATSARANEMDKENVNATETGVVTGRTSAFLIGKDDSFTIPLAGNFGGLVSTGISISGILHFANGMDKAAKFTPLNNQQLLKMSKAIDSPTLASSTINITTTNNKMSNTSFTTPPHRASNTNGGTPTKPKRNARKFRRDKQAEHLADAITKINKSFEAAHELSTGLDLSMEHLNDILGKAAVLHEALSSFKSILTIDADMDTARVVKESLNVLTNTTEAVLTNVAVHRGRAEHILINELDARYVLHWGEIPDRTGPSYADASTVTDNGTATATGTGTSTPVAGIVAAKEEEDDGDKSELGKEAADHDAASGTASTLGLDSEDGGVRFEE